MRRGRGRRASRSRTTSGPPPAGPEVISRMVPVHDGGQVPGTFPGDLPHDVLGDRREGNRLVHREERQAVAEAGLDQVVGYGAQLGLARREGADAYRRECADEGFRVRRVTAPGHPGEHQLAAREVAARVAQVRRHDAPDRTVQLVLATEQPQPERVGVQQCAEPHLVAADLFP